MRAVIIDNQLTAQGNSLTKLSNLVPLAVLLWVLWGVDAVDEVLVLAVVGPHLVGPQTTSAP